MTAVLAVDAGGSHTRAACIDETGRVIGWGTATGGNATSLGEQGLDAIEQACRTAIEQAGADAATLTAVLCAAGEAPTSRRALLASRLGFDDDTSWHIVGDALGAYFSGSSAPEGIVLVAGTGAVAARIEQSRLVEVVDGLGWLIGDKGGGFWIGREVVSCAAEAADGRGPATSLVEHLLARMPREQRPWSGVRTSEIAAILRGVYDRTPTVLADLAPLAFAAAAEGDAVASSILSAAAGHLARTVMTVRSGYEQLPVVVAGSVLTRGLLGAPGAFSSELHEALRGADVRHATDGVVGAAVLALQRGGIEVSDSVRVLLAEEVARRRR